MRKPWSQSRSDSFHIEFGQFPCCVLSLTFHPRLFICHIRGGGEFWGRKMKGWWECPAIEPDERKGVNWWRWRGAGWAPRFLYLSTPQWNIVNPNTYPVPREYFRFTGFSGCMIKSLCWCNDATINSKKPLRILCTSTSFTVKGFMTGLKSFYVPCCLVS